MDLSIKAIKIIIIREKLSTKLNANCRRYTGGSVVELVMTDGNVLSLPTNTIFSQFWSHEFHQIIAIQKSF